MTTVGDAMADRRRVGIAPAPPAAGASRDDVDPHMIEVNSRFGYSFASVSARPRWLRTFQRLHTSVEVYLWCVRQQRLVV